MDSPKLLHTTPGKEEYVKKIVSQLRTVASAECRAEGGVKVYLASDDPEEIQWLTLVLKCLPHVSDVTDMLGRGVEEFALAG